MKKLALVLSIILVLLLCPALAQVENRVTDMAQVFTADQVAELNRITSDIYAKYQFDLIIVTTQDSQGKSAKMFAADFYDSFHDYKSYPNGAVFAFCFDLKEYYEASRGIGMTLLSERGSEDLDELVSPYFQQKDYFGGLKAYANTVNHLLSQPAQTKTEKAFKTVRNYLPIIGIISVIIAFAGVSVLIAKLKTAKLQNEAALYIDENSFDLQNSSDIFLYQTMTRTKIETNSSSKSGSSSFSSSSGNSYGGRGGRL